MTRRERVLKTLAFEETGRVPMDLAGMASTSISCFAYPDLVRALGLPPRLPRVYDTGQMLALPDVDVLDALDCDVVVASMDMTNAFPQPAMWHECDFNGRLPAQVQDPAAFRVLEDGTIVQHESSTMPPMSHVFEGEHGGQPIVLDGDLPKPGLKQLKADLEKGQLRDEEIKAAAAFLKRVRESTDRAVFFNGPGAGISIGAFGGIAIFPMLCLTEPDFVAEMHEIVIGAAIEKIEALLPEIHPYIDIYQCSADDWGTQSQTIASPDTYKQLFQPYYRRFTDAIHTHGPNVKTFLHSCGAIYDILDHVVDSGFDIVNPVQWTGGGHSHREWKDKARNRITLWGGGVNTQVTLPLGSVEDVEREVSEIVHYMRQDGGFVFCAIHNILAEIPGEKVVAMYRSAASAS